MTSPNTTERFEYSWNENANVFFVDQPVGVGFSYADYGEQVVSCLNATVLAGSASPKTPSILQSTTADAAVDIASFVAIFFEHFPKFKGRPFHMAGESYGVSLQ